MSLRSTRTRGGMTLIELAVSLTMLGTFLGSLVLVLDRGSRSARTGMARQSIEGLAHRTIDRLADELVGAAAASLAPNPVAPYGAGAVSFQRVDEYADGAVQLGDVREFSLALESGELNDGLDNDGDGLVDERELTLTRDGDDGTPVTTVIAHGVAELLEGETANGLDDNGNGLKDEAGLSFQHLGGRLIVRLSLEGVDSEGHHLMRTLQTSVRLRN